MKKLLGLMIVLGLAAVPAFAQKVTVDYAHDFDFEAVKTFQYVETEETNAGNQMMADRVVESIKRELIEGGLKEVESDPDLYVTYHFTSKDQTVLNTTTMGYGGYGGGWGGYGGWGYGGGMGMASSSTTATTYTIGTLIIDAYEPSEKKMIWRGTGTVTVKSKPEKQAKQVDKILAKIASAWDKILKNQGK